MWIWKQFVVNGIETKIIIIVVMIVPIICQQNDLKFIQDIFDSFNDEFFS